MITLLLTLRLIQIVGGVAVGEVTTSAAITPDANMIVLDVTNRPDFKAGCAYSGSATSGSPAAQDTCTIAASGKTITVTALVSAFTAGEWTALQTSIGAGNATAIKAMRAFVSAPTQTQLTAILTQAVTAGLLTPARATAIYNAASAASP